MEQYTLFWNNGNRQVVEGKDLTNAMIVAGCQPGALNDLEFWCHGDDNEYEYSDHGWKKSA